jgi:glyoxylase-like metal-dependent hydrolase (beta-lactamase superfamily II)
MENISIGNFAITKIVESVAPAFPLNFLLPDAHASVIDEHSDWLFPHYVDRDSGNLMMSFHSYLICTPRYKILVDTCVGNHKERPGFDGMHQLNTDYLSTLKAAGVQPEDIDFVMCTHLHPDHVGWNTCLEDGRWVPTFPNARYLFGDTEFKAWQTAHSEVKDDEENPALIVTKLSYEDSVLPIVEANRAVMINDGHEVDTGFIVEAAPGHTAGNFIFRLDSNADSGVLAGDVTHHPLQLVYPQWSSGFCSDAQQSAQTRIRVLESIADSNSIYLPAHFPTPTWGPIERSGKGFRLGKCSH